MKSEKKKEERKNCSLHTQFTFNWKELDRFVTVKSLVEEIKLLTLRKLFFKRMCEFTSPTINQKVGGGTLRKINFQRKLED